MNQYGPTIIHAMPIVTNNVLPCIDFDVVDTPGDTHLIRILAVTGTVTNTGQSKVHHIIGCHIVLLLLFTHITYMLYSVLFYVCYI